MNAVTGDLTDVHQNKHPTLHVEMTAITAALETQQLDNPAG
jgi:hypothetical protein